MGTWVTTANQCASFLSDRIGYKSGLALSRDNMLELLDSNDPIVSIVNNTSDEVIRVKTNHILDSFQVILYRLGVIDISQKLVYLIKQSEEATPWDWLNARVFEWSSLIELKGLFDSESLETMYGSFLDQRYINYLAQNVDKISTMHWRKFEALTAEYYEKQGYQVELGAGRNDGGIDVRVWSPESSIKDAPVTIVQCKRTRAKIDKVLVKSLWADVIDERATSGVIVTSSYFSPGAREVCKARKYPIREANRDTVVSWLNDLKTTGRGVYMGE